MKYVAFNNTPVETNVSHHFAFRGCDDVTYILAEVLAAKMAKKCGVKYFILSEYYMYYTYIILLFLFIFIIFQI